MVFGFVEQEYRILQQQDRPQHRGPAAVHHLELRQQISGGIPYIASFSKDQQGKQLSDQLFLYEDEASAMRDWDLLIGPAVVTKDQLRYLEHIVSHHTGYGRNGSVTMY